MTEDKKPDKEWWGWYLSPPEDWRKKYGNALEFDELDHYYQALYDQKEKTNDTTRSSTAGA
jgi:hypothetical protein